MPRPSRAQTASEHSQAGQGGALPLSSRLSAAQARAVSHRGSDLQLIACAGSGKTETIAQRVGALIDEGTPPESIIAFTFTERAAAELKDRILKRVAERRGSGFLDRLGPMYVGTIHGYCFRLLQDHVPQYGNYDVLDEHRHAGLISREFFHLGISSVITARDATKEFIRTVDVIGNELIDPADLSGTPIGDCVEKYLAMLERYHFLTFGLIISKAVEALEDPRINARVRGALRHLIVDEYQDINPAQQRLISLLASEPVSLTVVGDDDQSIYQWRGSDVSHIVGFAHEREHVHAESLDTNRRSRPDIVKTANTFAQTIPGRLEKEMKPSRPAGQNEVVTWLAETDVSEAATIAEHIVRLHNLGYNYRDIAVLYRSVRTSAPVLIDACQARGIPVNCGGRTGLFLQPDVAVFGELYAWLADKDWKDQRFGSFRTPDLDSIVAHLSSTFDSQRPPAETRQYLLDWKSHCHRGTAPVSLVGHFYRHLYWLGAFRIDVDTPAGSARLGALARFSELLADFEHVTRRGRYLMENGRKVFRGGQDRGKQYFQRLHAYLVYYARDAYEDFAGEPAAELDAVDILTVHQAKGLEWPIVFLPALTNQRFPSSLAGRPQAWYLPAELFPQSMRRRYEGGDAEERRLFYVALTRARDCVYASSFKLLTRSVKISRYLAEITGGQPTTLGVLPLPSPPDPSGTRDQPPLELSFSDVALFEDCGYRYRLGTLLGFQQQLAVELGYGRAIHHVLRIVAETSRDEAEVPSDAELEALIDREFYLPFADHSGFTRMHSAANRLVRRYVTEYGDDLRRIWAIERPFQLHLPDGILAGRADVILDMENGRVSSLALVDYKLAKDEERVERYQRQLAVYAAAGRGEGLSIDAAYLHSLDDGRRDDVDISPRGVATAVASVASSMEEIRSGVFEPTIDTHKCSGCEYRYVCRVGAPKVGA